MFNQFRSALESVAQQPLRILDASENDSESHSSLEGARSSPLTSSQLTETAKSSLRKSFASQRVLPSDPPPKTPAARKSTLEERLRKAAQAPAVGDVARGRSDSVASQTKTTSSRVTSSSPMTKERVSDACSRTSRTTSPAPAPRTRAVESPRSKPPSRTASPVTRTVSRPPSRTSSSAPMDRATRTASPTPMTRTRPPSRAASPTPAARTRRASELAAESYRTSALTKNQSPLRRSSFVANKENLTTTSTITTSSSTRSEAESTIASSEDDTSALPVSSGDDKAREMEVDEKEETGDENLGVNGTAELSESAVEETAPGNSEKDSTIPIHEEESSLKIQLSDPAKSQVGLTNVVVESSPVVGASVVPSVPQIIPSGSQSPGHPTREAEETREDVTIEPVDQQLKDEEVIPQSSSPSPELQPQSPNEANLSSSTSSPMAAEGLPTNSDPLPTTTAQESEPSASKTFIDRSAEVEGLQTRLKEVEQRFSDVSTSFKRLQAEKLAADAILQENSSLESFNATALRDYFVNIKVKDEVFQEEIKRLTHKLEFQDDQLEELREIHKNEIHSLSDKLRKVQTQLAETEALFEAAQRATSNTEEVAEKQKEEISRFGKEVEQLKNLAKEEEEKRVKAITLLKTVRQKLVKAEKDREDVVKEMVTMKEKEKVDKDKELAERTNFLRELEASQATYAQEISGLKAQFNKDSATMRERYEQEINALRGQQELDLATAKTSYNKELSMKTSHISTLESSLNNVTRDKNAFFEQLQLRQAEVESAQTHLDTVQHQNTEFEFQLREANDRLALLREEYAELQREIEARSRDPTTSSDEIARLVSVTEIKYEAKLAEMKRNISVLEKERHESELDWSKKLKEKVKELEDLRRMLGSATRMRESEESMVANLKVELEAAQETIKGLQGEVVELPILREQIQELQRTFKEKEHEVDMKIHVLERQIEEHKAREAQLKQGNKTLRDELRKVQSSAALLERQRNPGVGYWGRGSSDASNGSAAEPRASISSPPPADTPSRSSSPAPSTSGSSKMDEEVNLEYVRNVVLQFLEHKEMRPHLVKVLSIILHFTPQETRRLIAKV